MRLKDIVEQEDANSAATHLVIITMQDINEQWYTTALRSNVRGDIFDWNAVLQFVSPDKESAAIKHEKLVEVLAPVPKPS